MCDELRNEYEGKNANRNIDVEKPPPGVVVGDPASQRWTNGRSADGRDPIQRKGQPAFLGGKAIAQDRLRHGLQASAERALHDSEQKKKPKAGGDPTEKGTDCKKHNAGHEEPFP